MLAHPLQNAGDRQEKAPCPRKSSLGNKYHVLVECPPDWARSNIHGGRDRCCRWFDYIFQEAPVSPSWPALRSEQHARIIAAVCFYDTEGHFDQTFDLNVKGTFFTAQKALPLLKDGGSIILNSSVSNVMGLPSFTVYAASKAAVRSFARGWTMELKDRKIPCEFDEPRSN